MQNLPNIQFTGSAPLTWKILCLKLDFWELFPEHQCPLLASLPNGSWSLQTSLFTLNFRTPSKLLRKQPPKPSFLLKFYLLKSPLMWLVAKTKFGLSVRFIVNPHYFGYFSALWLPLLLGLSLPLSYSSHTNFLAKRKLNLSPPRFEPTPCQS